jgi:hypothetical protein
MRASNSGMNASKQQGKDGWTLMTTKLEALERSYASHPELSSVLKSLKYLEHSHAEFEGKYAYVIYIYIYIYQHTVPN